MYVSNNYYRPTMRTPRLEQGYSLLFLTTVGYFSLFLGFFFFLHFAASRYFWATFWLLIATFRVRFCYLSLRLKYLRLLIATSEHFGYLSLLFSYFRLLISTSELLLTTYRHFLNTFGDIAFLNYFWTTFGYLSPLLFTFGYLLPFLCFLLFIATSKVNFWLFIATSELLFAT